jgi:hypothetical protein
MNKEIWDLLKVARETLEDARVLFQNQRYPATVERTYFAIEHAASAMLLHEGLKVETHYGVKVKFGEVFAKIGKVEKRFGRILSRAYDLRFGAEYVPAKRAGISREVAEEQLRTASEFLEMAEGFLKAGGALEDR